MDSQGKEPEKKQPMVYICGGILTFLFSYPAIYSYLKFLDCHGENELKPRDPIRCRECGYRKQYLDYLQFIS